MSYFFYNNQFYPNTHTPITPFDRGFTLGDGVFETIKVIHAIPELWIYHEKRLKHGCAVMSLHYPNNLYDNILKLIKKNTLYEAVLKIIITRHSLHRGLIIKNYLPSNIIMTLADLPRPLKKIKALISDIRRNETSPLSRIKSLNYGDNILAMHQAVTQGYDDALMLNTQKQPCCFTTGNIVIQTQEGALLTPPLATGCLDGCFLQTISGLQYKNFPLTSAVKIWRSNSIMGLQEVIINDAA